MKFVVEVSKHDDGAPVWYGWSVSFGPMVLDWGYYHPTEAAAEAAARDRLAEIMAEAGVQFVEEVA